MSDAGRSSMTSASPRRGDIQGLRAIAVLLVVAYHAGLPTRGGFIGVDVFFVISGYVIARLLVAELETTGKLDLAGFYARRVRRLLPALTVLLAGVALLGTLLLGPLGPQQATARTSLGASLFAANVQLFRTPTGYFDLGAGTNALLHTWSLSLEEQFYFVFPGALLACWMLADRRPAGITPRRLTAALVLIATSASFAVSEYVSHGRGEAVAHRLGGTVARFAFYMPVTRAWEFGLGILVALAARWFDRLGRPAAEVASLAGLALVAVAGASHIDTTHFPGTIALLPVGGTALAIAGGTAPANRVSRALGVRPLVWVGDLSYSWYLWHWPAIVIAAAIWPGAALAPALAASLALAPAWLSYRIVEDPIRRNRRLAGVTGWAVVATCIAASLAAGLGLRFVAGREARSSHAARLALALRRHQDELRGCDRGVPPGSAGDERCTWHATDPKGTIVLVGDSNAGQFTEPIARAAQAAGYDLVVATRPACPFVDLEVQVGHHDPLACRAFVERTLKALAAQRPALAIIASSASTYVEDRDIAIRDPGSAALVRTADAKARLWEAGVRSVVDEVARDGISTLLVHTAPRLVELHLDSCPFFRIWEGDAGCGFIASRASIERQQRRARGAEERALRGISKAHGLDVTDTLCTTLACPSARDGVWLYRDSGHLSVAGALTLAPRFARAIADALHAVPP